MNGISGPNTTTPRRRPWYVPNLTIRILLALIIAWLIVMAFFGTSAISH